jgi:hypothetical protein
MGREAHCKRCRAWLSLQASPISPEMAPCSVSADLPMAVRITYELPGFLLKLISLKGCLQFVLRGSRLPRSQSSLPLLSSPAAWVELRYSARRGTEEGAWRELTVSGWRSVTDTHNVHATKGGQHVAARILSKHIPPIVCGSAAIVALPTILSRMLGHASWYPVRLWVWDSHLITVYHWQKKQHRSILVPQPPGCSSVEDH